MKPGIRQEFLLPFARFYLHHTFETYLIGQEQNIFDLTMNYQREMFRVEGYGNDVSHPAIRVEVATETK